MPKNFLTCLTLLAGLASCQPTAKPEAAAPAAMGNMDHVAAPTSVPKSAGETETMRRHDALMGHMDSLMSEGQRLRQQAARLDTSAPAGRRKPPACAGSQPPWARPMLA